MAWQTLVVPKSRSEDWQARLAVPVVVTGLKAWHCRRDTSFFTHTLLHTSLEHCCAYYSFNSASSTGSSTGRCRATILWSAGEIDCREGMGGPLLEGYRGVDDDAAVHVRRTVGEYVAALRQLARQYRLQILVLPVAPHAHRSQRNGKSTGRAVRRRAMRAWNNELRRQIHRHQSADDEGIISTAGSSPPSVFLLDYERHLHPASGYVLHPWLNADGTHMNSSFLRHLEEAILECGCDLSLL